MYINSPNRHTQLDLKEPSELFSSIIWRKICTMFHSVHVCYSRPKLFSIPNMSTHNHSEISLHKDHTRESSSKSHSVYWNSNGCLSNKTNHQIYITLSHSTGSLFHLSYFRSMLNKIHWNMRLFMDLFYRFPENRHQRKRSGKLWFNGSGGRSTLVKGKPFSFRRRSRENNINGTWYRSCTRELCLGITCCERWVSIS